MSWEHSAAEMAILVSSISHENLKGWFYLQCFSGGSQYEQIYSGTLNNPNAAASSTTSTTTATTITSSSTSSSAPGTTSVTTTQVRLISDIVISFLYDVWDLLPANLFHPLLLLPQHIGDYTLLRAQEMRPSARINVSAVARFSPPCVINNNKLRNQSSEYTSKPVSVYQSISSVCMWLVFIFRAFLIS